MPIDAPYQPAAVFGDGDSTDRQPPHALIGPARYVQGPDVWLGLARYLSLVPTTRPAVIISSGGRRRQWPGIEEHLSASGVEAVPVEFRGECSSEEADRLATALRAISPSVDAVVAVGGGKCIDTGKCVAHRLDLPVVICPSLASNDAPCSALSVMYSADGIFAGVEFFPKSPALVAVDTRVVAEAPVRYLVAGMGDAMATWYESRTCLENRKARNVLGARPTLAAGALSRLCADTLLADGIAAVEAVKERKVTDALERVVEANTLLSGVGFESGGLAVAHSVAQGLTVLPALHRDYLHGEMVAIGLLTQLTLERCPDEARRVAEFFAAVGLPVHLGQVGLSPADGRQLTTVMEAALTIPIIENEPFEVTAAALIDAAREMHTLGSEIARATGDTAYRTLHRTA